MMITPTEILRIPESSGFSKMLSSMPKKNKIHSRPSRLRAWLSGVRCLHLALIASCLLLGVANASASSLTPEEQVEKMFTIMSGANKQKLSFEDFRSLIQITENKDHTREEWEELADTYEFEEEEGMPLNILNQIYGHITEESSILINGDYKKVIKADEDKRIRPTEPKVETPIRAAGGVGSPSAEQKLDEDTNGKENFGIGQTVWFKNDVSKGYCPQLVIKRRTQGKIIQTRQKTGLHKKTKKVQVGKLKALWVNPADLTLNYSDVCMPHVPK